MSDPLPIGALDRLARRELGGAATELRRLTGGASQELWSFAVPAAGMRYVLRRAPAARLGELLETVDLETEAAVIRCAATRDVPVAPVACVLRPDDGLGSGFIAQHMPGEALGRRIVAAGEYAAVRARLAADCGRTLAAIHDVPLAQLPDLPRRTPAQAVDQLDRQLRALDDAQPEFEAALIWLRRHCPPPQPPRLIHGDFRTGNFLLTSAGISAVLDWEACHLGDPLSDLGWLCMPSWRFGRFDLPVGGFGRREQLFAAYAEASGRQVEPGRVFFWQVHGVLRWGLTCVAMAGEFLQGDALLERGAVGRRASEAKFEIARVLQRSLLRA